MTGVDAPDADWLRPLWPEEDWPERLLTHFVGGQWRAPLGQGLRVGPDGLAVVQAGVADYVRARHAILAAVPVWQGQSAEMRRAALPAALLSGGAAAPAMGPIALIDAVAADHAAHLGAALLAGQGALILSDPSNPRAACTLVATLACSPLPAGVIALLHGALPEARDALG